MYHYQTKGTCSKEIILDIQDGIIVSCNIVGGCTGNTEGLCRMVIGRRADEVRKTLSGIQCRNGTSCPDQLSKAIGSYQTEKEGVIQ